MTKPSSDKRGIEIKKWLNTHSDVLKYAILDDKADMLENQKEFFVQTGHNQGSTEELADKVIEILR